MISNIFDDLSTMFYEIAENIDTHFSEEKAKQKPHQQYIC